jgi:hypothetical protein
MKLPLSYNFPYLSGGRNEYKQFPNPAETREPGSAREQVSLQFQTSDDARRARARGASALRVAGPRRDRIPAWDVPCRVSRPWCRLQGFPPVLHCCGGASFCVAPACPLPDVPPGGGRSADDRGVRSPGGIRCLPSHHSSAMPSHALALAIPAAVVEPGGTFPPRTHLLAYLNDCAQSCGLNLAGAGAGKGHGPGWRCARQPPTAAATRTEGGNAP